MKLDQVKRYLDTFADLHIGVLGDFCVDAYWLLDETKIEYSVETRKPTHAVCRQNYSLGGAGNVVSNLVALSVVDVKAFGVIGDDVFGREMLDLLHRRNVDATGMIVQKENWATSVYAKPYVDLEEKERIDFGRFNFISDATVDRLLDALEQAIENLDGLIVNQQLHQGVHSEYLITGLQKLIDQHPNRVILLDSRDISDRYRNVICKLNANEAARICGQKREVGQAIAAEELIDYARKIYGGTGRPVVITRSDRGIMAFDGNKVYHVPGVLIMGDIDPVGAGDATASVITAALSAGMKLPEAIEIGNYTAAIVVQKIRQTGTAGTQEILTLAADCDYVYCPEIADDIRKRKFWRDSEIEIVNRDLSFEQIKHVIFDHDGTISTLRQGWEQIMEPVMVKSILGRHYLDAPEELYQQVLRRVREYIDQSTGIETIVQMQTLEKMVRQFCLVETRDILDPAGYKQIYNQALMEMVRIRTGKLQRGELDPGDNTIKGAPEFLQALYECGVKLYLASGTDHADVVREANILGYADLFEDRIYGWTGQGNGSAKKMVIEQILHENKLSGSQLLCVGDGPVELRLCKKVGGLAVGVASDEIRRYGLNSAKRTRLIKAGADILISDYSQRETLLSLLFHQKETRNG
ncbi:MAG: PfkB family carbohydrate kinase [Phycisphaerae bacterium]